jgi:FtsH-binding integral membrane protein
VRRKFDLKRALAEVHFVARGNGEQIVTRPHWSAQGMFWAFCAVMGLSMASIFLVFTGTSIARTFFIAAAMFGATSLYGYTTKRDLSQFGSFLIMA